MVEAKQAASVTDERVLMHLEPGERFWKFFILTSPARPGKPSVEHRILTKEHADGSLELISYNAVRTDGRSEKRDLIRVPSLPKEMLDHIVQQVRQASAVSQEGFREIDLSTCPDVAAQVKELAKVGL